MDDNSLLGIVESGRPNKHKLLVSIDENPDGINEICDMSIFYFLIKENSNPLIRKKLVVPKLLQLIDDKSKIIQVETYRQRPASSSDLIGLNEIFIVFQTISEKDGDFWWSLDKFKDHVIVQRSHDKDAVKNNSKGERREGIEIIAEKLEGKGCITEILTILWIIMIIDIKYQRNLSRCESIIPLIMKKITKTRYEYENDFKYSALSAEEENPELSEMISFLSNVSNWHPLVIAIHLGDIELFDQVQQGGKYKINGIYDKFTLINLAILFSKIDVIQHLLEKMRVDPLKRDEMGRNALHMAAKFNRETEIIELLLLNRKIEIDQCDASGTTALNYAIMASDTKVVQCLLDKGANPKRLDKNDRSPLHVAAFYTRDTKIIDLLLHNETVDINECNKFGLTALHHAAKTSNYTAARHLMERGANVNCRDKRGLTPLHVAAFFAKDMDMIDLFLNNKKVDLHCCDELGQNVVAYAKKNIYGLRQQIIDRLKEKDDGIIKQNNLLKQAKSDMPEISIWRSYVDRLNEINGGIIKEYNLMKQAKSDIPDISIWNRLIWNPENKPKLFFIPCADLKPKMLELNPKLRLSSSDAVVKQLKLIKEKPKLEKIEVDLNKNLGHGGYGEVFQGVWRHTQMAVKRIPLDKVNSQEEVALKKMTHSNIVKLFDAESDDKYRYYVIELCQSSLEKLFLNDRDPQKYRGPMPSEIDVLIQLSTGLEFIHEMGYVHRDIKPQNILIWVDSTGKQLLMKWADFGLCKPVNERKSYTMTKAKGTPGWYAPEILKYIADGENSYADNEESPRGNVKSDVFSEGLLFGYFLLGGKHLFGTRFLRDSNIFNNNPVNLKDIQSPYRALIGQMLEPNPEKRISSVDVTQRLKNEIQG